MFHHTVQFRFNDGTTDAQIQVLTDALSRLPAAIPEITRYAFGIDAGINAGNSDFAVVAEFADRAGYLVYRDHSEHQRVLREVITPLLASRSAVQFEES